MVKHKSRNLQRFPKGNSIMLLLLRKLLIWRFGANGERRQSRTVLTNAKREDLAPSTKPPVPTPQTKNCVEENNTHIWKTSKTIKTKLSLNL